MLATHTHTHHQQQPFGTPSSLHPHLHHPHFPSSPPPQFVLPPVPLPPTSSFFTPSWGSIFRPAPSHKRRFDETEPVSAEQEGSSPKKLALEPVVPLWEVQATTITPELRAEDQAVMPEMEMASRSNEEGSGFEMGEVCW